MKTLALIIGKVLVRLGKLFGRGSSLPGYVALKVCPKFLEKIDFPPTVIMVTGTNGKTSVTHDLVGIFRKKGYQVITNEDGANISQGIATVALRYSDFGGNISEDVAILEVDEGYLPHIASMVVPTELVITNLFQDQTDRFGSARDLAAKMVKGIPASTKIYANGDDPIVYGMTRNLPNRKNYFGLDINQSGVSIREKCPNCGRTLKYRVIIYDHLGDYYCECGFDHPQIEDLGTGIDLRQGSFKLHGESYRCRNNALYFVYNALAAAALSLDFGIEPALIQDSLLGSKAIKGRMESVTFNGEKTYLNLIKNPAGANLSLDYMTKFNTKPFILFMAINNEYADGKDTSWLEKIHFAKLPEDLLVKFYFSGNCAEELRKVAERVYPNKEIYVNPSIEEAMKDLRAENTKACFLANYTTLAEVDREIKLNQA